jgi:DNA-binding response OmpR family regulator
MKTPRILIVDDEEDIREMYKTILRRQQIKDSVSDDKDARPLF